MSTLGHRASVEAVVAQRAGWHWLRLSVPDLATALAPGHAVLIGAQPWSVIRADGARGTVECLAAAGEPPAPGSVITVCGPTGRAFDPATASPRALLVGDLQGLAALVFLADRLRRAPGRIKVLLLLEAGPQGAPFEPAPSRIIVPDLPSWVVAAIPLCEDWGVPSRLAAPAGGPGCFEGSVTELAERWLDTLQGTADVTLFGCGAPELLALLDTLAGRRGLVAQLRPGRGD